MNPTTVTPGLVIAAPASGSGKTTVTLGLLRALRDDGLQVGSAKIGPDYIDPMFHSAATGKPCVNLDGWAMRPVLLDALAARATSNVDLLIIEGVMGLFDGAARVGALSNGSTADLADRQGWPIVLVIDAGAQAQSVAALAKGFRDHRASLALAGVILNRVGSPRHVRILTEALVSEGFTVFGAVPRDTRLAVPSRHLGLIQAGEHPELETYINRAARIIAANVDLTAIRSAAVPGSAGLTRRSPANRRTLSPLGQRIAIARDPAFGFSYDHLLESWREAGAEIFAFSPLAGEAPVESADAIFLPGGYPELHADALAANAAFLSGLQRAAAANKPVYGECGGYMVLGQTLVDGEGHSHRMAGLLGLETSFTKRRLSLGYRLAHTLIPTPFGPAGTPVRGHEFHYATVLSEAGDDPVFAAKDAEGQTVGDLGLASGSVFGSFLHLIDRAT
jgi:cobyrinic acid a,c-diamide synthase